MRGLASAHVASFDELDAPFFRRLGDYLQPVGFAGSSLAERLRALGRDPQGSPWEIDGPGLQVRLDVVPTAHRADWIDGPGSTPTEHAVGGAGLRRAGEWRSAAELASLTLTHEFGDGRLGFGYRTRLASQFGLRAGQLAPGTFTDADAFANPYLGFARDGASLGLATPLGTGSLRTAAFAATAQHSGGRDAHSDGITGAITEYRFGGLADSSLSLQAGWMSEANGAVGSRPDGAFGALRTGTDPHGAHGVPSSERELDVAGERARRCAPHGQFAPGHCARSIGTSERCLRARRHRPGCRPRR